MNIYLIAVGQRMPAWINQGYEEYAKRLKGACRLELIEVEAIKNVKNLSREKILEAEGERLLKAVPKNSRVIALDVKGENWDTPTLAQNIQNWQLECKAISLFVGGPEGLSEKCLKAAEKKWSLSALTFPHPLVRVILAEQIYRACSLLANHPYHRE